MEPKKTIYIEKAATCFLMHTPKGVKADLYTFKSNNIRKRKSIWKDES